MVKPETTPDSFALPPRGNRSSARYLLYLGGVLGVAGLGFALLRALLPLLQVSVPLLLGWWGWRRYCKQQQHQQEALDTVFYNLLQHHQGRITPLDFALTAKLPAIAARHYLDQKAKEFAAQFEVTESGDILYVFATLKGVQPQHPAKQSGLANGDGPILSPAVSPPPTYPQIAHSSGNGGNLLSQAELARRLNVSASTLSRKKLSSNLTEWTKNRDPDGVGWMYIVQAQRFVSVK